MTKIDPKMVLYGGAAVALLFVVYKGTAGIASAYNDWRTPEPAKPQGEASKTVESWWNSAWASFNTDPRYLDTSTSIFSAADIAYMAPAPQQQRAGDPGSSFAGVAAGNSSLWYSDPATMQQSGSLSQGWGETPGATYRGGLGSSVY
jgi:hypothetical protein